ncbi:MAG: hypothetical protein HN368_11390 [Spirochaetales bacterium]|nr:hypothetical protein [Spirochaetales bacterium]
MKRLNLISLPLLLILTLPLWSDDGSWAATSLIIEGALYIQDEHPFIELEKEFLIFEGFDSQKTQAVFFFKNSSDNGTEIEAGFPVLAEIELVIDEDKDRFYIGQGQYGDEGGSLDIAKAAFGPKLKNDKDLNDDDYWDMSPYYINIDESSGRTRVDRKDFYDIFNFQIEENGDEIFWDYVVIETEINREKYSSTARITFHFHHVLQFSARAVSEVSISYYSNLLTGESNNGFAFERYYNWRYFLGTGATWKNPIGVLYLIMPAELYPELPPDFHRVGEYKGKALFVAENYEPARNTVLSVGQSETSGLTESYYRYIWFDDARKVAPPDSPAQPFVRVNNASSYLRDQVTVYTSDGVMEKAGFGPIAMFDGVAETAWCEGVSGDGIGEWVEFSLIEDTEGLIFHNGFNMSLVEIREKNIHTYYEKNNRVKSLRISSLEGPDEYQINLDDTKEPQLFDDILLKSGSYRLTILDVYAGTRWADTLIGELKFFPFSRGVADVIEREPELPRFF